MLAELAQHVEGLGAGQGGERLHPHRTWQVDERHALTAGHEGGLTHQVQERLPQRRGDEHAVVDRAGERHDAHGGHGQGGLGPLHRGDVGAFGDALGQHGGDPGGSARRRPGDVTHIGRAAEAVFGHPGAHERAPHHRHPLDRSRAEALHQRQGLLDPVLHREHHGAPAGVGSQQRRHVEGLGGDQHQVGVAGGGGIVGGIDVVDLRAGLVGTDLQSLPAHRLGVGPAGHQHHLGARLGQPGAVHRAEGARTENDDPHVRSSAPAQWPDDGFRPAPE